MKNINKIISTLLAVLMIVSSFSMVVSAEDAIEVEYNTVGVQTLNYHTGRVVESISKNEDNKPVYTYVKDASGNEIVIDTAAEKLETMDLRIEKDGFRLYVDAYSGEVAAECVATGETIFTNPFNVGISKATESIKKQLLSQIAVEYTGITTNENGTYYSFKEASERNQIKVKNIKGGIRVEYSIGREQSKYLLPQMIEESDYKNIILAPLAEALGEDSYEYHKFDAFYVRMDKSEYSGEALAQVLKKYPMMDKMVYYRLDEKTSDVDMARLEEQVKTHIPDFTYEDLDEVHMKTEFQAEDTITPLFKLALEYTVDEDGLNVRLPANGLRYNESLYRVTSITILPYMGAASSEGEGYNFFPDGSGAIFDFDKIQELGSTTTITGQVYGQDYAYHTISGTHQEIIRYPVYGIVGSNVITVDETAEEGDELEGEPTEGDEIDNGDETEENEEEVVDTMSYTEDESEAESEEVTEDTSENVLLIAPAPSTTTATEPTNVERQSGFVAIVTEGDAMMDISSYHETQSHEYNTVQVTVYPRPQDNYDLSDAISVGAGGSVPVVSSRKYTGSYRIKYILLTSDEVAAEKGITDYYDCSYIGMAYAYRDYLVENGVLTRLTEEDVKEDIPLYIETFGTMETVEKFLSIPVTVLTPLTTFEDIKTMYEDLEAEGITNVNFKLTGYTNGGMVSTVPYRLKWEKTVGGAKGFEELTEYAKEKGFGIYPDFDFVYIQTSGAFDGLGMKKHAVKTIDNRYTSRREYSGTKQTYVSYYEIAISPAYFSHFYEKFTENYTKYDPIGISVSTLGSNLNSDFDKKEPYNREDSKQYTVNAFEYLDANYASVMTSSANSFTWKYVDHITDIALDSSRYAQAAASVPFLGIVLHGYVQIAGEPINMEGNTSYALLKAIESGAGLNFLLSYRNTDNLKEDEVLSKHYSVRYDIWFDDVVDLYTELNAALRDVQTSLIVNHGFVEGVRVPDADELESDAQATIEAIVKAEAEKLAAAKEATRLKLVNSRINIQKAYADLETMKTTLDSAMTKLTYDNSGVSYIEAIKGYISSYETASDLVDTLTAELEALKAAETPDEEAIAAKQAEIDAQQTAANEAITQINRAYNIVSSATAAINAYDTFANATSAAREGYDHLAAENAVSEELLAELLRRLEIVEADYELVVGKREEIFAFTEELYELVKDYIKATPYEYVEKSGSTGDNTQTGDEDAVPTKYQSDENMISYVEYENGISFLLNFNNYTVKVELDGTVYTIDEYGYVMFDERN